MVKTINAGVIGCNMTEEFFRHVETNTIESFLWKKIYTTNYSYHGRKPHPHAELVTDAEAIIHDPEIALVFVSASHLHFVKPVLDSGKAVRII